MGNKFFVLRNAMPRIKSTTIDQWVREGGREGWRRGMEAQERGLVRACESEGLVGGREGERDGGVGERGGATQERGRDWQECKTGGQEGSWWA